VDAILRHVAVMNGPDTFGPNLRRLRIQRGITLKQIAVRTDVSETLWAAMEHDDFSRWPNGAFARAFIRDYAGIVGADPDATVEEFGRLFPQGVRGIEKPAAPARAVTDLRQAVTDLRQIDQDLGWTADEAVFAAHLAAAQPSPQPSGVFGRVFRAFSRA
jgi:cytoskeletal protein RodZ